VLDDPKIAEENHDQERRLSKLVEQHPILTFAAGFVLYIVVGLTLLVVLHLYINPTTSAQKKDLIQALGFIMAGAAGVVGIYFTWRNLKQSQVSTQETLRITQEGQITERFTRAIDQLGALDEVETTHLEVRLGGIYALERIARDSVRSEDHWTVMEVLSAFVRTHAPWPPKSREEERVEVLDLPDLVERRPDVQAILTVIGRRSDVHREKEPRVLDLAETDLRFANLEEAHLEGVNFYRARLEEAYLGKSHLNGAYLYEAHLEDVDLSEAYLQGATLTGAHLESANLMGAHLEGADLSDVHLEGADLEGAFLEGAFIYNTRLEGADVRNADLRVDTPTTLNSDLISRTIGDDRTSLPAHVETPSWWVRGLPKNEGLEVEDYVIATFRPTLSFSIPDPFWFSGQNKPWQITIQNISKMSRISRYGDWMLNVFNARTGSIYDSAHPHGGERSPLPTDMISWFEQHTYLSTGSRVPVTVGGVDGTQIDIVVSSTPDKQPRRAAHPGVRVFRQGPGSYYLFNRGFKYQFTELHDVQGERIFILVESPVADFDELVSQTQTVLATVRWG
jgi:hypothetical protein